MLIHSRSPRRSGRGGGVWGGVGGGGGGGWGGGGGVGGQGLEKVIYRKGKLNSISKCRAGDKNFKAEALHV